MGMLMGLVSWSMISTRYSFVESCNDLLEIKACTTPNYFTETHTEVFGAGVKLHGTDIQSGIDSEL